MRSSSKLFLRSPKRFARYISALIILVLVFHNTQPRGDFWYMTNDFQFVFRLTNYDWMVISSNGGPDIAQGKGTLNGVGGYTFRVWLHLGSSTVRIQIYTETTRRQRDRRQLSQKIYYDSGVGGEFLSTTGCMAAH